MTNINKLWRKYVEGKCMHENVSEAPYGEEDFVYRTCIDCGAAGERNLLITSYDEDPAVILGAIKEHIGFIGYIPGGTWVVRHKNGTEKHDTFSGRSLERAVMLAVLKDKGVDVNN